MSKKKLITLLAVAGLVLALGFSGVADAAIIGTVNDPDDYTSSGVFTMNGINTIDGGSHWTHNDDLFKIGNRTTGSLTVSGGGWLEVTAASVGDTYALQVGNQGGGIAHMLITGTGSKVSTLTSTAVGRNESGCTLTIDDGGLLISEVVKLGRDGGEGKLRMGVGGMLAIEGAGKTLTSQLWSTDNSGEMQYNPLGDGTTWVNITGATGGGVDYTLADGTGDLAGYTVLEMVVAVTDVPGDVDGDGNVDLADMGIFEAQFGMSGLPLPPGENSPDLDADGDVDLDDLVFIRDNFGFVTPAAPAAATPEPATMTVLAIGGLAVLRRRRRKA